MRAAENSASERNSPAHAGMTELLAVFVYPNGEQPRSRGDDIARLVWGIIPVGTAPLTRG